MLIFQFQIVKLREYLPLQQGLRHYKFVISQFRKLSQRVSSITTRIKTFVTLLKTSVASPQRVSSITTRIKTLNSSKILSANSSLREYLPLQQGLRQARSSLMISSLLSQRVSSITTRIIYFIRVLFL